MRNYKRNFSEFFVYSGELIQKQKKERGENINNNHELSLYFILFFEAIIKCSSVVTYLLSIAAVLLIRLMRLIIIIQLIRVIYS